MFVEVWILVAVAIFAIGLAWSSIARGRTIRCLKACYFELLTQSATAFDHTSNSEDYVEYMRLITRRHAEMIARTGENPPQAGDVHYFLGER